MNLNESELGRLAQKRRERAVPVGRLGELRALALHRVLEARGQDEAVALALQRVDGLKEQLVAVLLLARHLALEVRDAGSAGDVLVEDELVADLREQAARGLLHAHADDGLAKLLELGDERREVRVAGEDGKGVDVVLGEADLHRVHGKADVGRVLAGVGAVRDLYELDAQLVEGRDGVREALPVAVGALRGDAALVDEALEDELDVGERAGLLVAATVAPPGAQGEVLKVDEHRDGALRVVGCVHEAGGSPCPA